MTHALLLTLVISLMTILLRFLPFWVFRRRTPSIILYLGQVLPYAIMGMLVVYCLKGVALSSLSGWLPQAISVAVVIILHKWKHSTLLSIVGGTACYMALVQLVFAV